MASKSEVIGISIVIGFLAGLILVLAFCVLWFLYVRARTDPGSEAKKQPSKVIDEAPSSVEVHKDGDESGGVATKLPETVPARSAAGSAFAAGAAASTAGSSIFQFNAKPDAPADDAQLSGLTAPSQPQDSSPRRSRAAVSQSSAASPRGPSTRAPSTSVVAGAAAAAAVAAAAPAASASHDEEPSAEAPATRLAPLPAEGDDVADVPSEAGFLAPAGGALLMPPAMFAVRHDADSRDQPLMHLQPPEDRARAMQQADAAAAAPPIPRLDLSRLAAPAVAATASEAPPSSTAYSSRAGSPAAASGVSAGLSVASIAPLQRVEPAPQDASGLHRLAQSDTPLALGGAPQLEVNASDPAPEVEVSPYTQIDNDDAQSFAVTAFLPIDDDGSMMSESGPLEPPPAPPAAATAAEQTAMLSSIASSGGLVKPSDFADFDATSHDFDSNTLSSGPLAAAQEAHEASEYQDLGVSAALTDGSTPKHVRSSKLAGLSTGLQSVDHLDEELPPGAVIRGRDTVLDSSRLPPGMRSAAGIHSSMTHSSDQDFDDNATAWSLSELERRDVPGAAAMSSPGRTPEGRRGSTSTPPGVSNALSDVSSDWGLSQMVPNTSQLAPSAFAAAPAPSVMTSNTFGLDAASTWNLSVADGPAAVNTEMLDRLDKTTDVQVPLRLLHGTAAAEEPQVPLRLLHGTSTSPEQPSLRQQHSGARFPRELPMEREVSLRQSLPPAMKIGDPEAAPDGEGAEGADAWAGGAKADDGKVNAWMSDVSEEVMRRIVSQRRRD